MIILPPLPNEPHVDHAASSVNLDPFLLQVHAAAQLHGDRRPHEGEPARPPGLGEVLLRTEKGHKS